jgi:small subunit ribosomal protein S21|tara:strand:+ start:180 stop:518 length:339 start_codon:yes stop_codon:yes gene_type:complete
MGYNKYYSNKTSSYPRSRGRDKNAPVRVPGLKVWVQHNDVDRALRKLKKKVANAGIVRELKEREYYEKPSERKRKQKARAIKRWEKKMAIDLKKQAYIEKSLVGDNKWSSKK